MGAIVYPRPWMTAARENQSISMGQLAEAVGTTRSHIWAIEKGQRTPRHDLAHKIAKALNVDVGNFLRTDAQIENVAVPEHSSA